MATKAEQYICTKNWARNKKGDIVERYLYNKYPIEIQQGNFKPVEATKPIIKATPAVQTSAHATVTLATTK